MEIFIVPISVRKEQKVICINLIVLSVHNVNIKVLLSSKIEKPLGANSSSTFLKVTHLMGVFVAVVAVIV